MAWGLIDDVRGDVWVVPAAGGEPRRLTSDDGVITFLEWSPDGESILYGTFGAGDDTGYAIRAVNVSSGDCRTITCGPLLGDASVAAWIADGKVVYSSPWKINKRIELVVCDPRDGTHETRMPDPEGQLFADMVAGFDSRAITPRILVDAAGEWAYVYVQAVDVAVGQGLADSTRVASFGLSSGGYLTAWLLTHSDRFRAGISECLVSDWTGMLGSDNPALVAASMDGSPGHGPDSMEPYMRMAPATYAARCSAPLLVLEHEDDLRCPTSQGDVLYNELKLAGKVTEMFRLPGVPHDPFGADLALRVQRAEAILDWMDRWLKPTDV
jgi:dipeptidyl aminopeptidase/acylaminoacyl peptidase